ncbi:MAG: hypothetical protein AAGG51_24020 [Cyanobacteria bacterium P01_G01_bin.54]
MSCPHCGSEKTVKNGTAKLKDQSHRQRYICREYNKRFNERTNTLMARLRTPVETVSAAINVTKRMEGLQRALDVQRLLHNGVRPHYSLGKKVTPAMAMGYWDGPLTTQEFLTLPGFPSLSP